MLFFRISHRPRPALRALAVGLWRQPNPATKARNTAGWLLSRMLSIRVISCLVGLAAASPAAAGLARAERPAQTQPAKARIELGKCDMQVVYNLPAQRFDETARAIAHATGCFIRYTDKKLMNVPVQPVRGRLTRRQALRVALSGTSLRIVRETPNLMEVKLATAH